MAKAVLRHHIANTTIKEVLTQREALRDKTRASMMEQVKGWGVWVEAVEICDVRICSQTLFQDLQAEFRHRSRRSAEEARLLADRDIQERALADELHIAKARAEAEAEKRLATARQALRAEQEEAALFAKQAEAAKARLLMEEEIELAQVAKELNVRKAKTAADAAVEETDHAAKLRRLRAQFDAERDMPAASVKRMALEMTAQIYEKLPLRDMRLNVFGSDATATPPAALLPGVAGLAKTWEVLGVAQDAER